MKYALMYLAVMYVVFCADDVKDFFEQRTWKQRIVRFVLWPITVTNWFRVQDIRLHRMLNILWCILVAGWFLSLMADRI